MNYFFNRIEICYYNLLLTTDNKLRKSILDKIFNIIKLYPLNIIDYIYKLNISTFIDNPYLLFFTLDLTAISNAIGFEIYYEKNGFHIKESNSTNK